MQPAPSAKTVQAINQRAALAEEVLAGKVDLRAYPHRYIVISHGSNTAPLLTAIEWMEGQSWELVNTYVFQFSFNALMRRR